MNAAPSGAPAPGHVRVPTCTIVWIDAREAVVVRLHDGQAQTARIASGVPAHHRATGHVRHDPAVRHGGGGHPQSAGEPRRLEHLERFVELVAACVPAEDDLIVLGPGTVREHLERHVREADERHGRARSVRGEPASPLTERQLVARLRHAIDADPPRRTVGGLPPRSTGETPPVRARRGPPVTSG